MKVLGDFVYRGQLSATQWIMVVSLLEFATNRKFTGADADALRAWHGRQIGTDTSHIAAGAWLSRMGEWRRRGLSERW